MTARVALLPLLLSAQACALAADKADDTGADGGGGGGGDSSGLSIVTLTMASGPNATLRDSGRPTGPGIPNADNTLSQGILTVLNDNTFEFFDLSLLGSADDGIGEGAVCRVFARFEESVDCGWFAGGAASFTLDDESVYSSLDWTETDGELVVSKLEPEGEGLSLSLTFWIDLSRTGDTARLEGEIVNGWLGP